MKKTFPGYFSLTDAEFGKLWEKCIFCIDANILLNLYRYSKETREEFFVLLKGLKDRLWIPHQAAKEYLDNRLGVIADQRKAYEETIDAFSKIIDNFKNTRKHPFVNSTLLDELDRIYGKVKGSLESHKKEHDIQIEHDFLQDEIISLLEGKVGPEYSVAHLKTIYKEGEERYKSKTPPGFKDIIKGSDPLPIKVYGDLVIWKQIIDKAKNDNVEIIFVTDDRKEDWWWIFNGKTIGPRPELIKEFQDQTSQIMYMYQPDRFMEFAGEHLSKTVKAEAIKEVKDIRKEDERLSGFMSLMTDAKKFNIYDPAAATLNIYHIINELEGLKAQHLAISKKRERLQSLLYHIKSTPNNFEKGEEEEIAKLISDAALQETLLLEDIKTKTLIKNTIFKNDNTV